MGQIRDELTRQWKQSRSYADQAIWIEETILPLKELQIDNAFLIGLGGMARFSRGSREIFEDHSIDDLLDQGGSEGRGVRGMTKLVAFECWLEVLRKLEYRMFAH
jgi:hypothetical protein